MSISPKRLRSNSTAPRRGGRIRTADQLYRELAHAVPDLSEGLPAFIASNAIDSIEQPPVGVGIPNSVFVNMKGVAERVAVKHSVLIDARALSEGMPVLVKARRDGFLWIRDLNVTEADRAFQTSLPIPNLTLLNHGHQSNAEGGTLDAAAIASGTLLLERGGTEANLGATGGANQFLKQSSVGAAVTVGTIGASDITTALTTPPAIGGTTPAAGKFSTLENTGAYVHNEAGGNVDARWEGDTDANLLFLDASADNLGIGTNAPNAAAKLHVASTVKGSIPYPVMTTAQRTAIGTPVVGLGVYDSDLDALYLYDGAGWVAVGSGGAVAFTDLTDAPSSYAGAAGKVVAVNGGETALELVTVGGGTPLSVTTVTTELAHLHYANTLGASGSFQAITALPSGYDRVKIRMHVRGTVAAASDIMNITINGDTTAANYHYQVIAGVNGASNASEADTRGVNQIPAASSTADAYADFEIEIEGYASTAHRKNVVTRRVEELTADNQIIALSLVVWQSSSAITDIDFTTDNDPTDQFVAGSWIEVWLIKDTAVVTAVTGGSGVLEVSTANISTPPTDAELDSAFGTPATVGTGFHAAVNDNAAGTNVYLVLSDGSNWWFSAMTKAT